MATSNTEISGSQPKESESDSKISAASPSSPPSPSSTSASAASTATSVSCSSLPPVPSQAEAKRSLPSDVGSDEDDPPASPSKKAKTAAALKKPNVAEENVLLLELKDDKNMKWPEIVEAFREYGWGGRKIGLLKNRYRSLKEGTVFWEDDDVDFMHQAIFKVELEYERTKWDSVAEMMVGLGASRRFTGAACEKKFKAKVESKRKGLEEKSLAEATSD